MRFVYGKRMVMYLSLLIICLIIMFILRNNLKSETSQIRDYPEILKEDTLRIVTDYNPLSYYVTQDSIIGFDYELANLISKRSGLAVLVFPEVSLSKSLQGLNKNVYDIVGRTLPVTTESKQEYNFTETILLNKQVLIQRKPEFNNNTKPIRNQLDLARKTLYIISDAPTRYRIENLAHEIGDTIYVKEETKYGAEQLVIMVAKGDIEFAVINENIAQQMASEFPEIDYQTDISFTQFQSWALRKTSPVLLDSLNVWLKDIKESAEFQILTKKYFGK
ncbi:transporter substrate-binding domain-containing protein [Coprobacter secundus]|uniref:transporter substrate-binding domain-containing protein n=2 Tax=Coprobacter secundus TaxID=1501392 RepID=UPI0005756591|nr:transporter substrate-binding domain-containing protein [Coprobacter secundus]KHM44937.1 glutamine ABC transporter substrate-binding protein [Coprobacter secundus]